MDFSLAIAQGFHNAPRLYGDQTVRKPIRITGMKSGLRAAGEEFSYGIYDAWTGLVLHPYRDTKRDGPIGIVTGTGKGVGGFVLKNISALVGPWGYTFKGIHKEMQKGRQPTEFIRRARIYQGQKEISNLTPAQKKEAEQRVLQGWSVVQELHATKNDRKHQSLFGRALVRREEKEWHKHGAFETVEQSKKALDARKEGRDLDAEFEVQMQEREKAKLPRESAMGPGVYGPDVAKSVEERKAENGRGNGSHEETNGQPSGGEAVNDGDRMANGDVNGHAVQGGHGLGYKAREKALNVAAPLTSQVKA